MFETDEPYLLEHDWILTMTNLHLLNMIENDWIWPKIDFRSYSPVNVPRCGDIYYIFHFRSYSPVKVPRCGNIYNIFGHFHHVKVSRCQFFGHVHKFRSNSFGHLHSVKLTFLSKNTEYFIKITDVHIINWQNRNKNSKIKIPLVCIDRVPYFHQ